MQEDTYLWLISCSHELERKLPCVLNIDSSLWISDLRYRMPQSTNILATWAYVMDVLASGEGDF